MSNLQIIERLQSLCYSLMDIVSAQQMELAEAGIMDAELDRMEREARAEFDRLLGDEELT